MPRWIPEGWYTVTTRLVAEDPAKLVRFLAEAFGASGEFNAHAPSVIKIGDSIVMVSGTGPRTATSSLIYLYVEDADATYERALKAGGLSLERPCDVPYGDRRATVKDPSGNDWQIATPKTTVL
jgi:PhnB protein